MTYDATIALPRTRIAIKDRNNTPHNVGMHLTSFRHTVRIRAAHSRDILLPYRIRATLSLQQSNQPYIHANFRISAETPITIIIAYSQQLYLSPN